MKLYNSLTCKKEEFKPTTSKVVKIYVCGITPYDTTHLGHAFTYISFDALIRFLQYKGYRIEYTQNVTDIDDDILKRAKQEKKDWKKLGDFWTKKFLTDMKSLNILPPTFYVKATESMDTIIAIVNTLKDKGYAYEKKGNVYFSTQKFKEYGQLSSFTREQMLLLSKERGADPTDPLKKDPLDFILWQKAKKDEPAWKSPWGKGRPGWHIECSAMVYDYLGDRIDIHGGGKDLIYPHHESEIAQSESYTGKKPFTKYWMHTAMVLYTGEKMSKSLGNLIMISDLLKKYTPNTIRYLLLSNHYRCPWEYTEEAIIEAQETMEHIEKMIRIKSSGKKHALAGTSMRKFIQQLENDFHTPSALAHMHEVSQKIEKEYQRANVKELQKTLREMLDILGFRLN